MEDEEEDDVEVHFEDPQDPFLAAIHVDDGEVITEVQEGPPYHCLFLWASWIPPGINGIHASQRMIEHHAKRVGMVRPEVMTADEMLEYLWQYRPTGNDFLFMRGDRFNTAVRHINPWDVVTWRRARLTRLVVMSNDYSSEESVGDSAGDSVSSAHEDIEEQIDEGMPDMERLHLEASRELAKHNRRKAREKARRDLIMAGPKDGTVF